MLHLDRLVWIFRVPMHTSPTATRFFCPPDTPLHVVMARVSIFVAADRFFSLCTSRLFFYLKMVPPIRTFACSSRLRMRSASWVLFFLSGSSLV